MLANFHFDIPLEYLSSNITDNGTTTTNITSQHSIFLNFRMVSSFEIIVFVWVFALFIEEIKQVLICTTKNNKKYMFKFIYKSFLWTKTLIP